MADQLLKNTCFHEINVAGIPDNTNITRIVSVNGNEATMHTRQVDAGAGASTDAFEPKIIDGARLFLITSYHEDKAVIDAAILTEAKKDERETIAAGDDAGGDDVTSKSSVEYNEKRVNELAAEADMTSVELNEAKKYFTNVDLIREFTLNRKTKEDIATLVAEKKAAADAEASSMDGGKRTRRRKNHGSKRRNASNKSGRRASKQSRRRGKKQSKRHGRK
jgi:hypothetical protein